ncbi:MAG: hypothetical protein RLZZ437_1149 [Pseudomonadota bacterium]|jgi:Invasion associated locus B (IalB) protein
MTYAIGRGVALTALAMTLAQGAAAQESTNNVAQLTDWSVFTDGNPKECWGVSAPKESTAQRDGNPVQVSRSDILLFVTYRTGGTPAEISFTGGYPFAPGSTVAMTIGSDKFDLFTDGEWAWPASPEADAALLAAMRNGTDATLVARSARGNETTDLFSLRGFTAANDEAKKQCQ